MSINEKMTAIADNMRNKLETTEKLGLDEMVAAVDSIYTKAHEQGVADGKQTAYNEVEYLNAELERTLYGTDTGGKSHYDVFWNAYQQSGNRANYSYCFAGYSWNLDTFHPKYDLKPTNANCMFNRFGGDSTNWANCDFVQILAQHGVVLDTSECTNLANMFTYAWIDRIGVIDCRKCAGLTGTFGFSKIRTIDKLIVGPTTTFGSTFQSQSTLENITFEGIIANNGLNFQWSTKLSRDSIASIIMHLSDDTSGLSVTFSKAAVEKAFETSEGANDGLINEMSDWNTFYCGIKHNWTISLV